MPSKGRFPATRPLRSRDISRGRYAHVEKQRDELLERLDCFAARKKAHPSYKSARILLNRRFRLASIDQRVAILKAADWFISMIEKRPDKLEG